MFKQRNIITAIELGTSKVCVLIGETDGETLSVIGRGETASGGAIVKGEIENMDLALEKLSDALEQADKESEHELTNTDMFVLPVTGCAIDSFVGNGTAFVQNEDQRITLEDMNEALRNAQVKPLGLDRTKINFVDAYFMIDDVRRVANPLDQNAHKIEAFTHVIHGDANRLENFSALLTDAGLDGTPERVFTPLADAYGVLTEDERDSGTLLLNLGAGTTEYAVIANGGMLASGVVTVGMEHVANDLSIGLNLPIAVCRAMIADGTLERLVRENQPHCECRTNSGATRRIPLDSFTRITDARLRETFEIIYRKLSREAFWRNLSSGAVLTGGGARFFQTVPIFHSVCDLPSRIGMPIDVNGASTDLADPRYGTVYGALCYGFERCKQLASSQRGGSALLSRIGEWGDSVARRLRSLRGTVKF